MAKRKRLSVPETKAAHPGAVPASAPGGLETKAVGGWVGMPPARRAPIADVAGEAAAQAALAEVSDAMQAARDEGRMILPLRLESIDEGYLVRDRMALDEDEMATLMASLDARGQQTPIEVVALKDPQPNAPSYGLISGWRRLTALKRLLGRTGEPRFAKVQALVRQPDAAAAAYMAMVEENEIRSGLSFYERARIAARAAEQGAFPTARYAVKGLFANVSAPKRSKINAFLTVYQALDAHLRFPAALPERLGLALAQALGASESAAEALRLALSGSAAANASEERKVLEKALAAPDAPRGRAAAPGSTSGPAAAGDAGPVQVTRRGTRLVVEGACVDAALEADLRAWLHARSA